MELRSKENIYMSVLRYNVTIQDTAGGKQPINVTIAIPVVSMVTFICSFPTAISTMNLQDECIAALIFLGGYSYAFSL